MCPALWNTQFFIQKVLNKWDLYCNNCGQYSNREMYFNKRSNNSLDLGKHFTSLLSRVTFKVLIKTFYNVIQHRVAFNLSFLLGMYDTKAPLDSTHHSRSMKTWLLGRYVNKIDTNVICNNNRLHKWKRQYEGVECFHFFIKK